MNTDTKSHIKSRIVDLENDILALEASIKTQKERLHDKQVLKDLYQTDLNKLGNEF